MPRLSKIGAAALAAFGWTGLSSVTASYLVVAGGGGGSNGGGGAGGYRTGTASLNPTESYAVTVGGGGAGGNPNSTTTGTNGSNSVFNAITSAGGGGGGIGGSGGTAPSGGSGGGAGGWDSSSLGGAGNTPSTSPSQGNNGGNGANSGAAGGGGAGAVGSNGSANTGGAGGAGSASSITGTSVTYAGGGGGRGFSSAGAGGAGGGGAGTTGSGTGSPGTANLGGGGGGSGATNAGAQGGSGVVIISYVGAQQFGGGVVTSSGGNTIHTFTTSGTLSPLSALTASYLIVAGGGGGGSRFGGGGGAGGLLSGSGVTIDTNSTYLVTVGAGGAGAPQNTGNAGTVSSAVSGTASSFSMVTTTAVGGGKGGSGDTNDQPPATGGSGGGSTGRFACSGASGTSGQGNAGGSSSGTLIAGTDTYRGSGGGGAGGAGAGSSSSSPYGGQGGVGVTSSISGTSTYYAGGGGGGTGAGVAGEGTQTGASGGLGGGGTGGNTSTLIGTAGTANTGGGGGGGVYYLGTNYAGAAGGSGVVIISYPGSTQQMAGGTVTVAGGNVIHTFTSSGYLTPIVLVNNSLRFRSSASAYLNRTPASASNRKTWTWSGWVKRGILGSRHQLFSAAGASTNTYIEFQSDQIMVEDYNPGVNMILRTTAVQRDPSAWYHFVVAVDTTQATSSNRLKIYINGVEQTAFASSTYPSQNYDTAVNSAVVHKIGQFPTNSDFSFDGYMDEINFIDGQALTPNSFGTSNGLGVWQPIRYGGSYGTNGFYLPFTNTTSTTTLGLDFSPNGNNWTTNNISLTAGSTYDIMTDVPTLTSATTANYGVYNPLNKFSATTISNGNLLVTNGSSGDGWSTTGSTFAFPQTGKWYAEFTIINRPFSGTTGIGIVPSNISFVNQSGDSARFAWGRVYFDNSGIIGPSNASVQNTSQAPTYTTGDIISVAFDSDNGTVWWAKNGTWTNSGNPATGTNPAYTGLTATAYPMGFVITSEGYSSSQIRGNWGQQPFAYTPPSGFVALNTFNLPTPTIGATAATTANKYMDVSLYSGTTGSNLTVTNSGSMQPDWVWLKARNQPYGNQLYDSVRGVQLRLRSNDTTAEVTNTGGVLSFNSTGFTIGTDAFINETGTTMVGWQWRAGGTPAVTNTAGSINSTVSANTTAGFSIVTYTGNATSGATVGHGLGVAPSMVILKSRSVATNWYVYHSGLTSAAYQVYLNLTAAQDNSVTTAFNSVAPGTTTFTLPGTGFGSNNSGATYVAYCFAQVAGYSAFGSYTGNGSSDGPFIYTGFRPRYILQKRSSGVDNWMIHDTARNPFNLANARLMASSADAESTADNQLDILSNGFKMRSSNTATNQSGETYIYAVFAENPFKYANAR